MPSTLDPDAHETRKKLHGLGHKALTLARDLNIALADARLDAKEVVCIVLDLWDLVVEASALLGHVPRPTPEEREARREARRKKREAVGG